MATRGEHMRIAVTGQCRLHRDTSVRTTARARTPGPRPGPVHPERTRRRPSRLHTGPSAYATLLTRRPDVVVHLRSNGRRSSFARGASEVCRHQRVWHGFRPVKAACGGAFRVWSWPAASSVYGDASAASHEDDRLAPLSPYAATKAATEALAQSYALRGLLEVLAVRPFAGYGPGQRPDMAIGRFLQLIRDGGRARLWPFVSRLHVCGRRGHGFSRSLHDERSHALSCLRPRVPQ